MTGTISDQMQERKLRAPIAIAKAVNGVELAKKFTRRIDEPRSLRAPAKTS